MDTADHPLAHLLQAPCEPPELDELPQSAYETFAKHADLLDDFYAGADVRDKWRERIARRAKLPSWEEVLAFVDLTAMGTARDFLVFGRAGLYYRQSADPSSTRFQPWSRVLAHRAGIDEGFRSEQLRIGEALYLLSGSNIDHDDLADLIDDLGGWAPLGEFSPEEVAYLQALTPTSGDPDGLFDIVNGYGHLDRLYVGLDMPDEQNLNCRKHTALDDDDPVVGLIDCSPGGGATDVLVFDADGVHHHHHADEVTPLYWSWPEVEASDITTSFENGPQLSIRGHAHTLVGDANELASIAEMVTAMAVHMCPEGTPPHDLSYLANSTMPGDLEADEGVESVPTVRAAADDDEFIESAFFFGHSINGVQFAPAITDETLSLAQELGPLPQDESIVAAVSYDRGRSALFLMTTTGIRYWNDDGATTPPPFVTWDEVRAILEDGSADDDDSDDEFEVVIGDISYSVKGADADNTEIAFLLLFLAYRAPAADPALA